MVGIGKRDAADAVLTAELDGAGHGGPRVEIAGSSTTLQALQSAELLNAMRGGVHVDEAVADHSKEAREALQAVRVDTVAGGLGKQTASSSAR